MARREHYPFGLTGVLGHEGAGIVRSIGSAVTTVQVGVRVVLSRAFCEECAACSAGRVAACPNTVGLALSGVRMDGTPTITDGTAARVSGGYRGDSSWATHALVREPNAVHLPDDIAWEVAAPFARGVQTGGGAILNVLKPEAPDSLVVFGAGTVADMASGVTIKPVLLFD